MSRFCKMWGSRSKLAYIQSYKRTFEGHIPEGVKAAVDKNLSSMAK